MIYKTAILRLYLKNFVGDFYVLYWYSNLLTLEKNSYNKFIQYVKLDIKYSRINKEQ